MHSLARRLGFAITALCLATATFLSPAAHAQRINVLIVGDSVASVLRWAPESMKPLWGSTYNVTLETWGCQKLLGAGCIESAKLSALDQIVKHRPDGINIVIVATGYNDTGADFVRNAMHKINAEAKSQGASLIWLTYRENGNVRVKNRAFNDVVKTESKKLHITVMDWELIARKNKHWFTGDRVHMNKFGGLQLARNIKIALDIKMGFARNSTTSTSTTVVATTVPS